METTGDTYMQIQNCMEKERDQRRLKRLWRSLEIHTCKYKFVWRDIERLKETKETVETVEMRYTCKYKIVWRDRERQREIKGD